LKAFAIDGFRLWLCSPRLQQRHFMRPSVHRGERDALWMIPLQAVSVDLSREREYSIDRVSVDTN